MKFITYRYLLELKIINGKTMCMPIRKTYLLNIPIHTRHTWGFHWFNVDDERFTNFLLKDAEHDIYIIKASYVRIKWAIELIIDILKLI